ncbi:uncharacterized protein VTP21DRAFT_9601 [Calcarisporiella thermophila]|uniref:uncharacterized protein n=1 Tax=Calcarisporiella thermophila TaxID=911321 RepID=UPI0037432071
MENKMDVEVEIPEEKRKEETDALVIADIKANFSHLERAVQSLETRFTARALRSNASIRRRLNAEVLERVIKDTHSKSNDVKTLLSYIDKDVESMDLETPNSDQQVLPEVDIYLRLLVLLYLLDKEQYDKGIKLADETVAKVQALNRRTMDLLQARVYFYYARFHEIKGQLDQIRPTLLAAQRTTALRRDDESQATLLNLLLRNYLHYNLYDQADKIVSKATFSDQVANAQLARYAYYLGRIKAIQLEYSTAHTQLLQAIRKAPQTPAATGFLQTVHKLFVIVQLLMGDIPERSIFRQPTLRKALTPYLHIVQAVRVGDLAKFQDTLQAHSVTFRADKNYTLIQRLRHNVIKTGVRMISLSYSRISLRDIAVKLRLDSEQDAEHIVAKAIRDRVIDAALDHERGFMWSRENPDVYSTNEPQAAYHHRIRFCLDLHNDAVRAMRFPLNAHRKELVSAEEARERERELAKEIEDIEDEMDEF